MVPLFSGTAFSKFGGTVGGGKRTLLWGDCFEVEFKSFGAGVWRGLIRGL